MLTSNTASSSDDTSIEADHINILSVNEAGPALNKSLLAYFLSIKDIMVRLAIFGELLPDGSQPAVVVERVSAKLKSKLSSVIDSARRRLIVAMRGRAIDVSSALRQYQESIDQLPPHLVARLDRLKVFLQKGSPVLLKERATQYTISAERAGRLRLIQSEFPAEEHLRFSQCFRDQPYGRELGVMTVNAYLFIPQPVSTFSRILDTKSDSQIKYQEALAAWQYLTILLSIVEEADATVFEMLSAIVNAEISCDGVTVYTTLEAQLSGATAADRLVFSTLTGAMNSGACLAAISRPLIRIQLLQTLQANRSVLPEAFYDLFHEVFKLNAQRDTAINLAQRAVVKLIAVILELKKIAPSFYRYFIPSDLLQALAVAKLLEVDDMMQVMFKDNIAQEFLAELKRNACDNSSMAFRVSSQIERLALSAPVDLPIVQIGEALNTDIRTQASILMREQCRSYLLPLVSLGATYQVPLPSECLAQILRHLIPAQNYADKTPEEAQIDLQNALENAAPLTAISRFYAQHSQAQSARVAALAVETDRYRVVAQLKEAENTDEAAAETSYRFLI